jgi:hypothetical protein
MFSPSLAEAVIAVRRGWLIITVVALAGAVAAFGLTARSEPVDQATAVITVDNLSIARYGMIVDPDRVLRMTQGTDFAEGLAGKTGVDAAAVSSSLGSYLGGLPTETLTITYRGEDPDQAKRMAQAAAEYAIERIAEMNAPDRDRQQALLEAAETGIARVDEALAAIPTVGEDVEASRAGLALQRVSLTGTKTSAEFAITLTDSAYTFTDAVTVQSVAPEQRSARNAVGGGVLGLALGIVLAWVREKIIPGDHAVS